MAEFRKITEVEEISELTGDENILISDHGCLKQINKKNAKLGGGVTVFTVNRSAEPQAVTDSPVAVQSDSGVSTQEISAYSILKEDGTEVTAQEIYDAFMSGLAILKIIDTQGYLIYGHVLSVIAMDESGNPSDGTNAAVIYLSACLDETIYSFTWPASLDALS